MKKNIYVDLDGTLVDFEGAVLQCPELRDTIVKNKITSLNELESIDPNFWEVIGKKPAWFWSNFDWLPRGKDLWKYIKDNFENISILTAPFDGSIASKHGKIEWVTNNLGFEIPIILCSYDKKYIYSSKNSILVDDRITIKDDWERNGGLFIYCSTPLDSLRLLELEISRGKRYERTKER
jgi:hypothetical protein